MRILRVCTNLAKTNQKVCASVNSRNQAEPQWRTRPVHPFKNVPHIIRERTAEEQADNMLRRPLLGISRPLRGASPHNGKRSSFVRSSKCRGRHRAITAAVVLGILAELANSPSSLEEGASPLHTAKLRLFCLPKYLPSTSLRRFTSVVAVREEGVSERLWRCAHAKKGAARGGVAGHPAGPQ